MIDCHTHSTFSDDSKINPVDGIEAALKIGLNGLIFTDHREFDYVNPDYKFDFDLNARSKILKSLQEKYHNKFKILQGVEIGVQPHVLDRLNSLVKDNELDFVLASVHSVDKQGIGLYKYHQGKTVDEIFNRYLNEVLFAVSNFKNYDAVGHIGYVRRYLNVADRSMPFKKYSEVIDAILKIVVDDGKGIEINTSGLRQGLGTPIPDFDIIQHYFELGGEIVTLGSDSHMPETIGFGFELARQRLLEMGVKYAAYFENRKPAFYSLKK